jgi:hypothetical protein
VIQSSNPAPENSEEGTLLFGVVEHALGVFDLSLIPPPGPNDERDYFLSFDGGLQRDLRPRDGDPRP